MIRKKFIKFIAILGVVLLGGAVAVGWTPTALAAEISYSFEVRLKQRLGNLKKGDTLTGSWTVDTTDVNPDVTFTQFGFFEVTSFQVHDPQNGGTWTDDPDDPGVGAAIIGNDILSFSIQGGGGGGLKHTCPKNSFCDAYAVGFEAHESKVIGPSGTSFSFAGVRSITDPLDKAGGLTLDDLGFMFVFEGDPDVFPTLGDPNNPDLPVHPTGDEFFSKMLLFIGGVFKDPRDCGTPGEPPPQTCIDEVGEVGETFATIDIVSVSLTPSSSPSLVPLDIKPGSFSNSINLKSKDVIPVAILTTEAFDATAVDPGTVIFGPGDAMEKHGVGHIEDIDSDGDDDVVYHFSTQDSGIECGDPTATLTGETFGGEPVTGSDSIVTQGCQ